MRYAIRLCALLFSFAAVMGTAAAAPTLDLSRVGDFQELSPYVELAVDPTNNKGVQAMSGAAFTPVSRIELSDSHSTYWLRFRVLSQIHEPWVLTTGFRPAQADLFVPDTGGYRQLTSGDSVPYANRPLQAFNWIAFPLPNSASPQMLYLRIRTIEPLVNVVAYTAQRFREDNIRDIVVIAALLGVLVSLALSSVVLYFVMRDSLYLYYALYIVAQIIYRANDFGLFGAYVFSHAIFGYVRTEVVFDGLTLIAATVFIRRFLKSHAHSVILDRLNVAIAAVGATYTLLAFAGVPIQYTLVQKFSFIYVPVWLITGVVCWRRGYAPARLFIFAWAAYMVGIVLEATVDLGLTAQMGIVRESPPDVILDYVVYLGIALESILLSLSLAHSYRAATTERERIAESSIRHLRELIEMRERSERMTQLAYSDALTHLPNRTAFLERVDEALHAAARQAGRSALIYMDLDDFKAINDTLGHPAGDSALVEAARRLREIAGNDEIVGRLGGDEFAIFLPEIKDRGEPERVVARIIAAFAAPMAVGERQKVIGVSIGVAVFPADAANREGLIAFADAAMYKNKGKGQGTAKAFENVEPIMD